MSASLSIIKSSPWFKRTVLLASWALSVVILTIFAANSELNTHYNEAASPELRSFKNQIGALSCTRWDPKENGRPIYSFYFKNLLAENNKLGIFKTGLHKVVKIQDLELKFHRYTSPKVTSLMRLNNSKFPKVTITKVAPVPENTITGVKTLIGSVEELIHPKDGWRIDIDLSNVSEVRVNNFDYEILCDGELLFGVQSKRAIASSKWPEVILRGHAIITTCSSTLEGNYIKWDIENQRFTVKGIYVLNCNGVKTTGKDIRVDAQLKSLKVRHVEFKRKEKRKCFVKL